MNFIYQNNTPSDLGSFHTEIVESLRTKGEMPEELADMFEATLVPPEFGNPDGSPRWVINAK